MSHLVKQRILNSNSKPGVKIMFVHRERGPFGSIFSTTLDRVPTSLDQIIHTSISRLYVTHTKEIALIIRALVTAFGGTEAVEGAISSDVFPIPLVYDMFRMPNLNFKISFLAK